MINLPGGREHFDIYLAKTIYPVLVPGLENLAREIDRLINSDERIDPSIRERFNPCIFLGEFLMRNNQKHGVKLEYQEIFDKYAKIEKLRRFFSVKRQKIYKLYMTQPYQGYPMKGYLNDFTKAIDEFLKMEGKLVKHFKPEE